MTDKPAPDRFTGFTDQERALLIFGITLTLAEMTEGIATGDPWPIQTIRRDLPTLITLANELGAPYGQHLDTDTTESLIAQATARHLDPNSSRPAH